jgi:osmotically inducible protein OsmC
MANPYILRHIGKRLQRTIMEPIQTKEDVMAVRKAQAVWKGNLQEGNGRIMFGDGVFDKPFSFSSRFEQGEGTNPEELIAAAHAGCFSMALAHALSEKGYKAEEIETTAEVTLNAEGDNIAISTSKLYAHVSVPGIEKDAFTEIARGATANCPVSRALAGVKISLEAKLAT